MVPKGVEMVESIGSQTAKTAENAENGEDEQTMSPAAAAHVSETDVLLGVTSAEVVSLSVSDHAETGVVSDSAGSNGSGSLVKERDITIQQRLKDFAVYTTLLGLAGIFAFVTFAITYRECVFLSYRSAPFVLVNSGAQNSSLHPVGQDRTMLNALVAKGLGTPENPIRISFYGDSLVTDSALRYDLFGVIKSGLADQGVTLSFAMKNLASAGCRMNCINEKIAKWNYLTIYDPHIVVLLSDADLSDTWESHKFPWDAYKQSYRNWMTNILELVEAHVGKNNFALANPALVSEGPLLAPARMRNLDGHTEDLRAICKDVASYYPGVVFIDQVASMRSVMVSWWKIYSLYNTRDGTHFSKLGVKLFAANCVRFLLS